MPTTFQIAGPTKVMIGASELGRSDNDNLPQVSITDNIYEVKEVTSGATPAELVLQGLAATVTVTLVKYDEAILSSTLITQRGVATFPGRSTVGRALVSAGGTFAVTIESLMPGRTMKYVFPRAYLKSDGMVDAQWGNRERTLTLTFGALADDEGDVYEYTNTVNP
jgi:hypothetical protein